MLKITKLLEESGARYQVCDYSVYFWVAVNDNGQMNVVMAIFCLIKKERGFLMERLSCKK